MGKRKIQESTLICIILIVLLFTGYSRPVMAAQEKDNKKGSIEILVESREKMFLEYVKVGEMIEGKPVLLERYKKSGVDIGKIHKSEEARKAAEELGRYFEGKKLKQIDTETGNKIEGLDKGIYLLRKSDESEDKEVVPILLTIPMWDEEIQEEIYDVTVIPKYITVKENSVAPQTNLDTHVRLYACAAFILLISAVILFGKARGEYLPYIEMKANEGELKEYVMKTPEVAVENNGRDVDFAKLSRINSDIVGWIYIPGTNIDYPILIGETDEAYLQKDFQKAKSKLGSIFGFSDMERDLSEAHICLFGHNMRSAQMFGELKNYKKESFLKEHARIYIDTPESTKVFTVFSVYECESTDQTFAHKMKRGTQKFRDLAAMMRERSTVSGQDINAAYAEQILTLTSCRDYSETSVRFTVHAVLTEESKRG